MCPGNASIVRALHPRHELIVLNLTLVADTSQVRILAVRWS